MIGTKQRGYCWLHVEVVGLTLVLCILGLLFFSEAV